MMMLLHLNYITLYNNGSNEQLAGIPDNNKEKTQFHRKECQTNGECRTHILHYIHTYELSVDTTKQCV